MNNSAIGLLALIGFVLLIAYFVRASNAKTPKWDGSIMGASPSGIPGDFDFAAAAGTTSMQNGPNILTRSYRGKLEEATWAFQRDAANLAISGYRPVAQNYVPGSYSCAAFLVALILCILLIGILIFIYMIIVKPPGTLMVTYQREPQVPVG